MIARARVFKLKRAGGLFVLLFGLSISACYHNAAPAPDNDITAIVVHEVRGLGAGHDLQDFFVVINNLGCGFFAGQSETLKGQYIADMDYANVAREINTLPWRSATSTGPTIYAVDAGGTLIDSYKADGSGPLHLRNASDPHTGAPVSDLMGSVIAGFAFHSFWTTRRQVPGAGKAAITDQTRLRKRCAWPRKQILTAMTYS